jgi:ankyrin repeat protein
MLFLIASLLLSHTMAQRQTQRIDTRDTSQPQKKDIKQTSLAEAAKIAAREKMSEKFWSKCENGSLVTQKELMRLIKMGADIEWKNPGRGDFTCLLVAAWRGHLRTVRLLLSVGANKEAKTKIATPLRLAAQEGHIAVVNALLASGAEKEAKTKGGATPLYISAQFGHLTVVDALLAAGADKEAMMPDRSTPLYIAAQNGHFADALLSVDVNKEAKGPDKAPPLYIAAQNGHLAIVDALLAAGANPNAKANIGFTPLSIAAQQGYLAIADALLAVGSNPDVRRTSESHRSSSLLKKVTSPSCVRC